MADNADDKRVQRTRQALLGAFFELVLDRRYGEIRIDDIVKRSGVARSTFYEHFANKDALLASALHGPFSQMAQAVRADCDMARLRMIVQHFWDNRGMARGIMTGVVRRKAVGVLANLIEEQLRRDGLARPGALLMPPSLASAQLAEMLLTPLTTWLAGGAMMSAEALASGLQLSASAALAALRADARASA